MLIYFCSKRCSDNIVYILLVSFNVLIVSMIFFISVQCMHAYRTVLAVVFVLYLYIGSVTNVAIM